MQVTILDLIDENTDDSAIILSLPLFTRILCQKLIKLF